MKFIKKHWVAIITLTIMLTGIITVLNAALWLISLI
jgi:hypothetical protein